MINYRIKFMEKQKDLKLKPSIIVVTPSPELGEIICESLKEHANIEHFSKIPDAISSITRDEKCQQVILDMELGELSLLDLGSALRLINPKIEFLIISKDEPPTDLERILPWKFLRKPILLHDLLAALGIETAPDGETSNIINLDILENENTATLHWTNNAGLATRYLAQLIEKSFAQEALLIQNQVVWSYAGRLPEESVQELNVKINKVMNQETKCDCTKFIRLETTQTEYTLYASLLALGVILALVFDPDIPFGIVRKKTKELANTLLLLDSDDIRLKSLSAGRMESKGIFEEKTIPMQQNILPSSFGAEFGADDGLESSSIGYSVNNSLNPLPNRQSNPKSIDQVPGLDLINDLRLTNQGGGSAPAVKEKNVKENGYKQDFTQPERHQLSLMNEFLPDALYNLSYSFLLITRFDSNYPPLDRDEIIKDCIKKLHVSYGWKLESLEIHQDFLRWVSSFPPTFAPSRHIETIRKETSKRLFEDFPQFKQVNLSGDYWAPGYLVVGGNNAISDQLVSAYIKQNRQKYSVLID